MTRNIQVDRIAAGQCGLLSREQALAAGVSPAGISRRLGSGEWIRALPGVYRLAAVPRGDDQDTLAAWLWAGEGSAISHRAAARLLGLEGMKGNTIDLRIPRSIRSPSPNIELHIAPRLLSKDLKRHGPLVITSPTRTLIDLGLVVSREALELAVEDALRRGLTSVPALDRRLAEIGGPGSRGAGALGRLLSRRAPGRAAESLLEVRVLRLIRKAGLPDPVRQHEIRVGGGVLARIDFAYPDARLAIECEGYRFHSARSAWEHDRGRLNALAGLGWTVFHVTWKLAERHPDKLVADIGAMLCSLRDPARSAPSNAKRRNAPASRRRRLS